MLACIYDMTCKMIKVTYLLHCSCTTAEQYVLYPWVHQYCNVAGFEDQVRSIKIPDIAPSDIPKNASFSMCAGDFLMVYNDSGNKLISLISGIKKVFFT